MKTKCFFTAKVRALCVMLILILLLPSFSACNAAPKSMEELQKNIRISNNCMCLHKISFSVPNELWDHPLTAVPNTYEDPDFQDIDVEKYTYKGVEYTLTSPITQRLDDTCGEKIYTLVAANEEGNKIVIRYINEDKAPLYYKPAEPYGNEIEEFDSDDMVEAAEDFVDYVVNDNSTDSINIAKYSVVDIEPDDTTQKVVFKRYYHGIPVHTVTVGINDKCQAEYISMSTPILDESVYKLIPNITDEQYSELAQEVVNRIYLEEHDAFTISDFSINAKLNESGYTFTYSHNEESYVITYVPIFNVSLPDGTYEEAPMFLVSYVLDPKAETEGQ